MHGFRKSNLFFVRGTQFSCRLHQKNAKCGSSAAPGRSARGLPDSPTGVECAKMLQVSTLLPPAPSLPTPSSSGASRRSGHARQLPLNGVVPTAKLTTGGVWEPLHMHPASYTCTRHTGSTRVLLVRIPVHETRTATCAGPDLPMDKGHAQSPEYP